MALVRSLITTAFIGDVSRDFCSHTVYHTIGAVGSTLGDADYGQHADEILAAFTGGTDDPGFLTYAHRNVQVRVYDLADAEPRPERAYREHVGDAAYAATVPGELSVVLSFVAGRNIPGRRGRLFLGPFSGISGEAMERRPNAAMRTSALALGSALFNIGGANVTHVLFHQGIQTSAKGVKPATYGPTKTGHAPGSYDDITSYNVADSWGVVHSRGLRATLRQTITP